MQELIQRILPGDQHPTLMLQKIRRRCLYSPMRSLEDSIVDSEIISPGQDTAIKAGRIGSVPNGFGDRPDIKLIELPTGRMRVSQPRVLGSPGVQLSRVGIGAEDPQGPHPHQGAVAWLAGSASCSAASAGASLALLAARKARSVAAPMSKGAERYQAT